MTNDNYNHEMLNEKTNPRQSVYSWNWAAFSIPVIWGLFHGVLWPIAAKIAIFIISNVAGVWWVDEPNDAQTLAITFFSLALNLVLNFYLGFKADKIGDFSGCEHEKGWKNVGIILAIPYIIGSLYFIAKGISILW